MKKTFYSFLLAGLMMLWAVPQARADVQCTVAENLAYGVYANQAGESALPAQVNVAAWATVSIKSGKGQVDVVNNDNVGAAGTRNYSSVEVRRTLEQLVCTGGVLLNGGAWLYGYYYAIPAVGYYFKEWVNAETNEAFPASQFTEEKPLCDSVFSSRGILENQFFAPFEENQHPDELQSFNTYQAVFAPIPVYGCSQGQVETIYLNETSKTWNVSFSTAFARSMSDFNSPSFAQTETEGGTFSLGTATLSAEGDVVTVPVTFTLKQGATEGVYTADLTLASVGDASLTITLKVFVEEAIPDGVVATVINGTDETNYTTFEQALTKVPADGTLQLRRDINLTAMQNITKKFTLDLNGKVLSSTVSPLLNIAGGDLTIVDSKMIGQISLTAAADAADDAPAVRVTTGSLTMNRGTIAAKANSATKGAMAVQVLGGTFTLNDGLLQATANNNAAAILNYGGTVIMKAGELQATAATNVATLAAYAGTTTVENGSITATLTGSDTGAGVYVLKDATVIVQRAKVTATATGSFTGGLFAAYAEGTLSISKKAELKAITTNDVAVCALYWTETATITLNGVKMAAQKNWENENTYESLFEFGFPNMPSNSQAVAGLKMQAVFLVTGKDDLDQMITYLGAGNVMTAYRVAAGVEYNEGYRAFIGASYEKAKTNGVSMFRIDDKAYTSLEDALLYAQNNPSEGVTILQVNDYTLPDGYYTLPANATLLIPYAANQNVPRKSSVYRVPYEKNKKPETPYPYLTLTLSASAHLDVYGTIEAGGKQHTADAAEPGAGAFVEGSYGWMKLEQGSTMTMENGAILYAWGYVTGQGEIDARRGSQVREFFTIADWPGAGNAVTRWSANIFPLCQYFIQNVEAPVSYHPGAKLYASFAATAPSYGLTLAADGIQIVGVDGENAIFLMDDKADADNTWVRKWYDVENDKQVYDVNSGAYLGSLLIPLPALRSFGGMVEQTGLDGFDSKLFVLPLTSNMKIHLLTGTLDITQATEMLPGAEIEVDKTATVTVRDKLSMNDGSKRDVNLYLIDADEWDQNYAYQAKINTIAYTPSTPDNKPAVDRTEMPLEDAKLNVHGTFMINGKLFTTTSGANVFSTNDDAGTIRFEQTMPAAEDVTIKLYHAVGGESYPIDVIPALLQNSAGQDPAFANSEKTPAGQSYCFINDRWTVLYNFADMYVKAGFAESVDDINDSTYVYNNYGEWYIKPAAYVAVRTIQSDAYTTLAGKPTTRPLENADHTYSDAAGEGRLFIFLDDQWWEVTLENNLYRGTNGTYYYYDEDAEGWKEKQFDINFVNWDGQPVVETYSLSYGVMPKYNSTNPTRAEDVDYTYTFTGWTPALAPVTGNATYTATYKATQRKYTIVFLNENGTEIERHFLTRDEVPACDNLPTKTGYFLTWSPGIGAVTGNQTYQAVFTPELPTEFTITFKNYDGAVLKQEDEETDAIYTVEAGESLLDVYNGATPTKEIDGSEYTYTFTGWAPAITEDMVASEDMTFTAQFSENRKQATVIFYEEDGETVLSSQTVDYGQFPTVPVYQKDANAEYTYTMGWNPQVSAVSTSGIIKYTATPDSVKNRYTVTVNTAGCVAVGVGTYEYGTEVTLHLVASEGFENARWSDGTSDDKTITVTGNVALTASAQASSSSDNTLLVGYSDEPVVLNEETSVVAFTIEASADGAGSLIHPELLQLKAGGTAYYRYLFDATARTWYAFSVPFECNAQTATGASGNTLRLAYDYDIIRYNGATRAAHGKDNSAWEYLSDFGVNTLTPGVLYMIRFKHNQTSLTFTKKAGASIVYTTPVTLNTYNEQTNNDGKDANWNGVAMSNLYTSYMTTGTTYGQVYNGDGYDDVTMGTGNQAFQIGKPVFIQAASETTIIQSQSISTSAPVRRTAANSDEIQVALSQDGEQLCRVYVKADEDAEDRYVIGQDLAKMGVSSTKGQVWVNRYDARLLVNVTAPENEVAVFPLGISAPKAGAYTLSAPRGTGSATLYLMENGQVIANLTEGDYTLDLNKGTTEAYSLRMVLRPRGVVTDLDEAATIEGVQKVIKDGTLYIIRDGKAYTVQGQAVDAE